MTTANTPLDTRREIVLFVEVRDGNPNGDPDMGNAPRQDANSGHGMMTDVSIKRVIRDYVSDVMDQVPGNRIFISEGAILERLQQEGFEATGNVPATHVAEGEQDAGATDASGKKGKKPPAPRRPKGDPEAEVRRWLCEQFFDVRAFGAVLAGKKYAAGCVNGPIHVAFARSVDPITVEEVAITRCAVTNENDAAKERTIGRKHIVPYALYRLEIRVAPFRAMLPKGSGFGEADMLVLERALLDAFEHRKTASKGYMATRAAFVFEHSSALGNAPAHELMERVKAERQVDFPRAFADYKVTVDAENLPEGVALRVLR